MPQGDGTGPSGQGPRTGRGRGGMSGDRLGAGPGGNCMCPNCGTKVAHQAGAPCSSVSCPQCGIRMVREG